MCVLINFCCVRLNKCNLFSNERNMMASIKFNFYGVGNATYWTSFAYHHEYFVGVFDSFFRLCNWKNCWR